MFFVIQIMLMGAYFLSSSFVWADDLVLSERLVRALAGVNKYNDHQGIVVSKEAKTEVNEHAVIFSNEIPLDKPIESLRDPDRTKQNFSVTTIFLRDSPTIEKRVRIRQGPEDSTTMRFVLSSTLKGKYMPQTVYQRDHERWQIYEDDANVFFYTQNQTADQKVEVKEWIYAEKPNSRKGSVFKWKTYSEDFNRFMELDEQSDGSIAINRHVMVGGVKPKDYKEQKRIVGVVNKAMKDIPHYIYGEDRLGTVEPVRYWTREGFAKKGVMKVKDHKELLVVINEPAGAYPIIIDPSLMFSLKKE